MGKKTNKKAKAAMAEALQELRGRDSWITTADGVRNWDTYPDDLPAETPEEVGTALTEFVAAQENAKAKFEALEKAIDEAIG